MIGVLRRLDPNIRIILGGGLITSWLRRPGWRNPFEGIIDELVAGEGEAALLSILDREYTAGSDIADFNHFSPLPYLSPGFILPYSASAGCYWRRCAFCPERAEANPYRPVPSARVVSQLQSQIPILKPVLVHFTDNAVSPALLKALCREPCGVPWYGFVRITRHLADLDFCKALKRSGCIMLQIGLESGSQTVLDGFCKGIDLNIAQRALENLKHAGIAAYVYLLFGTPWETEADAIKTFEFTIRNSGTITFLNLAIFNLPAFGPHTDSLNTRPLDTGDMFLYRRFEHPAGWHRQRYPSDFWKTSSSVIRRLHQSFALTHRFLPRTMHHFSFRKPYDSVAEGDPFRSLCWAGKSDWRLPAVSELESLLDRTRYRPIMREEIPFRDTLSYWSSTTFGHNKNNAWIVMFDGAYVLSYYKTNEYHVLYVRG